MIYMSAESKYRILTASILIILLFSLFIWYGGIKPDPDKGNYPGSEQLIEDYDRYVGKKAEITGEVIDKDPIKIEIEHGNKKAGLTITGTNEDVEKGDRLTVFGTVKQNHTIESENSFSVPFLNYIYMYGISGIAAVWILIRIIKQWKWSKERSRLEKREEPIPLKQIFKGGEDDG